MSDSSYSEEKKIDDVAVRDKYSVEMDPPPPTSLDDSYTMDSPKPTHPPKEVNKMISKLHDISKRLDTEFTASSSSATTIPKQRSSWNVVLQIIRSILLDLPLAVVLASFLVLTWTEHVQHRYLDPQISALYWTDERAEKEITYYTRFCTADDMSTSDGTDLFLSPTATAQEAYEHHLTHGFTIFPNVLSQETATNLRDYIAEKNYKLAPSESIFVIENDNRYSFGLGTEEPTVAAAMSELATHKQLTESLEAILGPNPALIEMTAITISYGAVNQWWHDDVIPSASAVKYANTFSPSYSVFIQLQNTTREMGSTGACPGTHFCGDGHIDVFCEEEGFQVIGPEGVWKAGDALLMNMNSYHRGSAHTDPNASDRIMLILTFVAQPIARAEPRQMSQGITFSLRWDMWGHTLYDLQRATTRMTQPWATLRSLGLYKPKDADWGIDYISSTSMRLDNDPNGFNHKDLAEFLESGAWKYLPEFLYPELDDEEGWYSYVSKVLKNCLHFSKRTLVAVSSAYVTLHFAISLFRADGVHFFFGSVQRLLVICSILYMLFFAAKYHVDNSDWARDITEGRRYTSVVENEEKYGVVEAGPSTLPTSHDVLIEHRLGAKHLAMYTDYINFHPGNRVLNGAIKSMAPVYKDYPDYLQTASVEYVIDTIEMADMQGRFLDQGPGGSWHIMPRQSIQKYVHNELSSAALPAVGALRREIRHMIAALRFGIYRANAISTTHTVPYLKKLEAAFLSSGGPDKVKHNKTVRPSVEQDDFSLHTALLPVPALMTSKPALGDTAPFRNLRSVQLPLPFHRSEPVLDEWLQSGDTVEVDEGGFWYLAELNHVSAHAQYHIRWALGEDDEDIIDAYGLRRAVPYQVGEELEVLLEEGDYVHCVVEEVYDDGLTDLYVPHADHLLEAVNPMFIRRERNDDVERTEYKSAYGQ